MSYGDRHANRYVALSIATSCNMFAARARMLSSFQEFVHRIILPYGYNTNGGRKIVFHFAFAGVLRPFGSKKAIVN